MDMELMGIPLHNLLHPSCKLNLGANNGRDCHVTHLPSAQRPLRSKLRENFRYIKQLEAQRCSINDPYFLGLFT
jgi:hypothetical protein